MLLRLAVNILVYNFYVGYKLYNVLVFVFYQWKPLSYELYSLSDPERTSTEDAKLEMTIIAYIYYLLSNI